MVLLASFIVVLDKKTTEFATINVQQWLSTLVHGQSKAVKALLNANNMALDGIEQWVDVCRLLHYFPPEYLSKSSRLELAKRALAADVLLQALALRDESTLPMLAEWRGILRSFVVTVVTHTQTKTLEDTVCPLSVIDLHVFMKLTLILGHNSRVDAIHDTLEVFTYVV